jgi:hypothetical protein
MSLPTVVSIRDREKWTSKSKEKRQQELHAEGGKRWRGQKKRRNSTRGQAEERGGESEESKKGAGEGL